MKHEGLIILAFGAALVVMFAIPARLARVSSLSKWGSILVSTVVSPFLMLGAVKIAAVAYWALNSSGARAGCAGGECGGASYAGGLWPLLIPMLLPFTFVASWIVVSLMRKTMR